MNFTSQPQQSFDFSAADRRLFVSLATTKGRKDSGFFMAQGTKCVLDTLPHFSLVALLATANWSERYGAHLDVKVVKRKDIERITTLSTPLR